MTNVSSLLIHDGVLSVVEMEKALHHQVIYGYDLTTAILALGLLDEKTMTEYQALSFNLPALDPGEFENIDAAVLRSVPYDVANKHAILPVRIENGVMILAVDAPLPSETRDILSFLFDLRFDERIVLSVRLAVERRRAYGIPIPSQYEIVEKKIPQRWPRHAEPILSPTRRTLHPMTPVAEDIKDTKPRFSSLPSGPIVEEDALAPETKLDFAELRKRLTIASTREEITQLIAEAAGRVFSFAAVLLVAPNGFLRKVASWTRDGIPCPLFPAEGFRPEGAFKTAIVTSSFVIGPYGTSETEREILRAMGRDSMKSCAVLPVSVGSRVPLLVLGDTGAASYKDETLYALLGLLHDVPYHLMRVIKERKTDVPPVPAVLPSDRVTLPPKGAAWDVAQREATPVPLDPSIPLAKVVDASFVKPAVPIRETWLPPFTAPPSDRVTTRTPSIMVEMKEEIGRLVERVLNADAFDEVAANILVGMGRDALEALVKVFPGPLVLDRKAEAGRSRPLADHGPLLRALMRFEPNALIPLLVPRMESADVTIRFYATLFLSTLSHPGIIRGLAGRLYDREIQIRTMAMEALKRLKVFAEYRWVVKDIVNVLNNHRAPKEARWISADALGEFGEFTAVASLITLVENADENLAIRAQRALVHITFADFGFSQARWAGWWVNNQGKHRLEMAIDAVDHKNPEIAQDALGEIVAAGGESLDATQLHGSGHHRADMKRYLLRWWQREGGRHLVS